MQQPSVRTLPVTDYPGASTILQTMHVENYTFAEFMHGTFHFMPVVDITASSVLAVAYVF